MKFFLKKVKKLKNVLKKASLDFPFDGRLWLSDGQAFKHCVLLNGVNDLPTNLIVVMINCSKKIGHFK